MQNIFVYGTLQSELIIKKLTGKTFHSLPAILNGYKRYCVKDRDYPAIVAEADSETKGLVLENVDERSLDIISFYEGDEYEKKIVFVLLNNKLTDVLAFVWVKGNEDLDNKEWDLDNFEKTVLEQYLDVIIPETLEVFHRK